MFLLSRASSRINIIDYFPLHFRFRELSEDVVGAFGQAEKAAEKAGAALYNERPDALLPCVRSPPPK